MNNVESKEKQKTSEVGENIGRIYSFLNDLKPKEKRSVDFGVGPLILMQQKKYRSLIDCI